MDNENKATGTTDLRLTLAEKDLQKIFNKLDKISEISLKNEMTIKSICQKLDIQNSCDDTFRESVISRFAVQQAALEGLDKDIGRVAQKYRIIEKENNEQSTHLALMTQQNEKTQRLIRVVGGTITTALVAAILKLILI